MFITLWDSLLTFVSCADAGHISLLKARALEPLLEGATETRAGQQGPWQGGLPLQALAALAMPRSPLRSHILSSIQQLLPAMLAASVSHEHNQQMLTGVLHAVRHKTAPFADSERGVAASISQDLFSGIVQLTKVSQCCSCLSSICTALMEKRTLMFLSWLCC